MRLSTTLRIAAGLAISAALTPHLASACIPAVALGRFINIAHEDALIVWNARRHREDFIRRADFQTNAKDFGFLVPVPSTPTLTEVDDAAFDDLESMATPPETTLSIHGAKPNAVRVLPRTAAIAVVAEKNVAGYHAAVLAATDSANLKSWLRRNGYSVPGGFEKWATPYLRKHWEIVAFKMSREGHSSNDVSSQLVRISFHTTRPFYPYSEPPQKRIAGNRELNLYVLSSTPVSSQLAARPWVASRSVYRSLDSSDVANLAEHIKRNRRDLPHRPVLTYFDDTSNPRRGIADLYFTPSD